MKHIITDFQTGIKEVVEFTDSEKLEVEYYNNHIAPKEAMESLRTRRNQLLTESDWTQSRDVFLSNDEEWKTCLLYTSPSPRDNTTSRMPSSA